MGLDHFASPWFLLLLLLLPGVVLLARRSLAGLSPARRWTAVALRLLALVLLILALAELAWIHVDDKLAVIYAVDVSASIPPAHREAALDYVKRSSRLRDPVRGDWTGLILFGKTSGVEISPKAEALAFAGLNTLVERDFTDIQSAVRLAGALFPERMAKRLVLITDGNENRGKALEEARAAKEKGIEIVALPVSYAYPGEVLLDKVVVDPEVHRGEPFDVRVVVEATRKTRAMLRLFENQVAIHGREVELKEGKNVFVVQRRLEADGRYLYDAVVEPLIPQDDALTQNNSAHGFTSIHGLPRILFAGVTEDGALPRALREEGHNVEVLQPGELPGSLEEYLAYDAIILSNVAADALGEERMKMFESLVKAVGIGFVMVGGDESFGPGGYQGTPVEELLPVEMEIKQKKVLPNGALAIVMHSCEINNGNYWAVKTVEQAIKVLSPRDYAGVLFYDYQGGEKWLFPLTLVSQRSKMLSLLSTFSPGDMPDFSRIVTLAHAGLKKTPAAIKHMIVLSDGDPNPPSTAQIQAMRADAITLSTICMGWHSTPTAMQNMARLGGGKFYSLTNPQQLPSIFVREATTVRKSLISERDFKALPRSGASFLRGVGLEAAPVLKGYVIASQKPSASQDLVAPPLPDDPTLDPILSSWAYGLGKSVAFTSDAGRRWAAEWIGWQDYRKLWGQIVRWVSRQGSDQRLRATRSIDGETGSITVDGIDEAGNFLNGLDFEGALVDPDFRTQSVDIRQVAPGRYRADFPAEKQGTYLLNLRYTSDGQPRSFSTGLSVPYSPEYRRLETNHELLERLTAATGGRVLASDDPAAPFARDYPPNRSARELWRDLLKAAAVIFFADVFVRRVAIDWAALARRGLAAATAVLTRRRRAQVPADPRMEALLRRKTQVRQRESEGKKFFEPTKVGVEPLDPRFVAGAGPSGSSPHRTAPMPAVDKPAAVSAPTGDSYTGRLLEAKRRARAKRDGEDRPQ